MSKCKCSVTQGSSQPNEVNIQTQVTPEDVGRIEMIDDEVTEKQVEQEVIMVNPDPESMDSRG